jgi:hypothetical protein
VTAVLLMLLNGCGTNKTVLEEIVEQVYTVQPTAEISIYNRNGAVLVYGSELSELRLRCTKKAYNSERLSEIAIDVSEKPGAVSVTAKFPPQPKWGFSDRSGTVDCTVVVPMRASISALELDAGEVLLDSMVGKEVRAWLGDGRIFARNCFTNLNLTMDRGTLTVAYDWWEQEKLSTRAKVGQGNAWVWAPSDAAFHLLADATHGKVANDFNDLPISAHPSGDGMKVDQIINGGGQASIEIRIEKGNIKIGEANP